MLPGEIAFMAFVLVGFAAFLVTLAMVSRTG